MRLFLKDKNCFFEKSKNPLQMDFFKVRVSDPAGDLLMHLSLYDNRKHKPSAYSIKSSYTFIM